MRTHRPAFTLDADGSTPPLPIWQNDVLTALALPPGSRVLYPAEPISPLVAFRKQVTHALENPVDGDPLDARLKAGMSLTIAFDDLSATDRAIASPDPRSIVLEAVLSLAAAAHIDDVQLISARGLARRMRKAELYTVVGERITDSFVVTDLLTQHDADDESGLEKLPGSQHAFNKRVIESDLLVYLSIDPPGPVPYRNLATRLSAAESSRQIADLADSNEVAKLGAALEKCTPIFQVAVSLNNAQFTGAFSFLQKRINEWNALDKAALNAMTSTLKAVPQPVRTRFVKFPPSSQKPIGVFAGSVTATHTAAQAKNKEQYGITDFEPADVLVMGMPPASPYSINSVLNPILAAHNALSIAVPNDGSQSLVRQGGALIVHQGMNATFDPANQPSFLDFFNQLLPAGTDDLSKHEEAFANDAWYSHLYRTSYAHHGTLPFQLWNETERARTHLGGIIAVGGDTSTAHRLGFRRASTFEDALEMARDITGSTRPSLNHVPFPSPRAGI